MAEISSSSFRAVIRRFLIAVVFSIAFGYIEGAVVVYLRAIFYPEGFSFPLTNFGVGDLWRRLLLTEAGREAATMVVIFTAAWLFGRNRAQRFAYFLVIFAVWDISYYVWLKALLGWPASVMDWDVLFLIPVIWASPVLAPVLVSLAMLTFAIVILYQDYCGVAVKATSKDCICFALAGFVIVLSFCIAGLHASESLYRSYFSWWLFSFGYVFAITIFAKCLFGSK